MKWNGKSYKAPNSYIKQKQKIAFPIWFLPPPLQQRDRGNVDGNWSHDKFGNNGRSGQQRQRATGGSTKLMVSNLDGRVTDADMRVRVVWRTDLALELFQNIGPLKKANVHFDSSGKSLGTADIEFQKRGDAQKAFSQFKGIQLDNRLLKMVIVDAAPQRSDVATRITQTGNRSRRK
eukprot:Awhi_evm1s11492